LEAIGCEAENRLDAAVGGCEAEGDGDGDEVYIRDVGENGVVSECKFAEGPVYVDVWV